MDSPILDRLARIRVIPIVVIDDPSRADTLADALVAGGLPCAEITFRTMGGEAALRATASRQDILVGAGTVLTADQVDRAADAGARFIVSPGFGSDVVTRAQELGIAVLPGISTASELQAAARAGLNAVKFFPAAQSGGLGMLSALSGPFPDMRFMPSGGVRLANAAEYLAHPAVFAVGGSWMVPRERIAVGDFETVRRMAVETARLLDDGASDAR